MLRSNVATGAVGVVFSMMAVIQAVGFSSATAAATSSPELGRRNTDSASNMAATGFFSALFTGLLICVFGEIFLTPLAAFLGSSPPFCPMPRTTCASSHRRAVDDRLPGTEQPAALPGQRHLRHHRHRQRRRAEHRAGSPADLRL
ncbi:MAG: MATE family efflux transporter [Dysosmobacter welbionis]